MTNTMTTNGPKGASSATAVARADHSAPAANLTRLVLIGAITVFLSVFGLTIAASEVTGAGNGGGDVVTVRDNSGQPMRVAPHVRTRTS